MAHPKKSTDKLSLNRSGATLIDVALGSMLLTIILLPAIHMIGKSQSANRRLANREIMLYEAEQMIELLKVKLSEPASFDAVLAKPIDSTGKISVSDGPSLLGRTRVAADPSMPTAKLLTIIADVWNDVDQDGTFDPTEPGETLQTQWAAP